VRSHVACGVFDSPQLPEGIDLMSLYAYVNFTDQGVLDDGEHYWMNADATVSLSISQLDTKHEFDDLAHVLTSALACHREAGSLRVDAQGLLVKPVGDIY